MSGLSMITLRLGMSVACRAILVVRFILILWFRERRFVFNSLAGAFERRS